jgi:hypothetical protein
MQLEEVPFQDQIDFVSKVAKTEAEACVPIKAGFKFACDFDGHKRLDKAMVFYFINVSGSGS